VDKKRCKEKEIDREKKNIRAKKKKEKKPEWIRHHDSHDGKPSCLLCVFRHNVHI
jgi:hypothetical protein